MVSCRAFPQSLLAIAFILSIVGCAREAPSVPEGEEEVAREIETSAGVVVRPIADVAWGALNPARGAAGPRAGDLWGDRTQSGATGFLVRFAEGFSSPPHIHNVTYRGVVIEGLVHNDDPDAARLWMPVGSYWTQPAGEVHITSAEGEGRMAYIEIESGPYLVRPVEQASDNGERALNVHADNLVWLDASTTSSIQLLEGMDPTQGPHLAYLWGDPQASTTSGAMLRVPAGMRIGLESPDGNFLLVVVKGGISLQRKEGAVDLAPGSFVGGPGQLTSSLAFTATDPTWLYLRGAGRFDLVARTR